MRHNRPGTRRQRIKLNHLSAHVSGCCSRRRYGDGHRGARIIHVVINLRLTGGDARFFFSKCLPTVFHSDRVATANGRLMTPCGPVTSLPLKNSVVCLRFVVQLMRKDVLTVRPSTCIAMSMNSIVYHSKCHDSLTCSSNLLILARAHVRCS